MTRLTPTPLEELRKAHPDQKRIDAETVELLRNTSWQIVPSPQPRPLPPPLPVADRPRPA